MIIYNVNDYLSKLVTTYTICECANQKSEKYFIRFLRVSPRRVIDVPEGGSRNGGVWG